MSYVHSNANSNATNLNRFNDGLASALILTQGPASMVTEATLGFDDNKGDGYGLNLQPGWFLTRRMQVVGRYQIAGSNEDNGLKAQRRYERGVGLSTGDFYQAAYFGINYYILEHRMKVMTGVEYSEMDGDPCWTGSTAIRVFWGPHSKGPFPMAQVLRPTWDDAD